MENWENKRRRKTGREEKNNEKTASFKNTQVCGVLNCKFVNSLFFFLVIIATVSKYAYVELNFHLKKPLKSVSMRNVYQYISAKVLLSLKSNKLFYSFIKNTAEQLFFSYLEVENIND